MASSITLRRRSNSALSASRHPHRGHLCLQPRKVKNEAIPEWAEGLYYNKGLFSEVLVYHDDESIYFEHRGKESAVVRFRFEMV